ncbi:hypothetical protein DCCM_2143 [Desulfocucumis palustris]|uniref:Uncharacterized protein n=1 Tax=Desulfocucumis palustris TaxID=1898651 RepID=A0A2L2XFN7_9FIRM|nr:hypothetical protein DCCM_2143 [Desulfocucumis palustris]
MHYIIQSPSIPEIRLYINFTSLFVNIQLIFYKIQRKYKERTGSGL